MSATTLLLDKWRHQFPKCGYVYPRGRRQDEMCTSASATQESAVNFNPFCQKHAKFWRDTLEYRQYMKEYQNAQKIDAEARTAI